MDGDRLGNLAAISARLAYTIRYSQRSGLPLNDASGIAAMTPVTEEGLHVQVAKFLNQTLTGNTWWSTMPLGGGGLLRGARLKRAGTRKGLPDILVIDSGRACWIELKRAKGGRLSDEQIGVHAQLRRARTPVTVCRSLDEVIAALSRHGVPMRGINA